MKSSIEIFEVILDQPNRVYSPGEYVNGKIIFQAKQTVKRHKLYLQCRGEAYVSWPESTGTYTRYRFGKEELYDIKSCLYDNASSNQDGSPSEIQSDRSHSFSFRFTIPYQDLPPSYEGIHGNIRYSIRAELQNEKGKTKAKTAEALFIIGNYEEFDDEEIAGIRDNEQREINGTEQTTVLGRPCYPSGLVTLSAHTNKLLYHSGETIQITACIESELLNEPRVHTTLIRVTKYSDLKGHTTYSSTRILSKENKDSNKESMEILLQIPHEIYPTMTLGSTCININYQVEVRLRTGTKSRKEPTLLIPIIIISKPSTTSSTTSEVPTNHSVSTLGTLFIVTGQPMGRTLRHNGPSHSYFNDNKRHRRFYTNINHAVSYV